MCVYMDAYIMCVHGCIQVHNNMTKWHLFMCMCAKKRASICWSRASFITETFVQFFFIFDLCICILCMRVLTWSKSTVTYVSMYVCIISQRHEIGLSVTQFIYVYIDCVCIYIIFRLCMNNLCILPRPISVIASQPPKDCVAAILAFAWAWMWAWAWACTWGSKLSGLVEHHAQVEPTKASPRARLNSYSTTLSELVAVMLRSLWINLAWPWPCVSTSQCPTWRSYDNSHATVRLISGQDWWFEGASYSHNSFHTGSGPEHTTISNHYGILHSMS